MLVNDTTTLGQITANDQKSGQKQYLYPLFSTEIH